MFAKAVLVSALAATALAAPQEKRQIGSAIDSITSVAGSAITAGASDARRHLPQHPPGVRGYSDAISVGSGLIETITSEADGVHTSSPP
ncbi:hypothetical protein BD626DRAFT_572049 [Schizophyllum amplum]|uniref:Uncharacterized protein n=1 Tax=Schizophyllum amplum TaxID=97359 RepID=A0A550C665_9AGAR|nr:hypothetical protein BD626DRAFT_572049 [Auriculariopsis ampla]